MTLLSITQDVAVLVGLQQPAAALTSTDLTTQQIVALLQQEGDELSGVINWNELKVAGTITGDGTTTLWSVPSDYDRLIPGQALWSTKYPAVPLGGPITDAEMLALKALPIQPVRPVWRFFASQIEIWPALSSAEVVNYTYFTDQWILAADTVTKRDRWGADTDTARIPEKLITLGGIWRWKRAKGFDYSEEFASYEREKERMAGQSGGARTISMASGLRPDGIWGPSPINPIIVT